MMKKILVACGTGMSTSTMIAQKLQDFLAEQGIAATTAQCCLNEIPLNCNEHCGSGRDFYSARVWLQFRAVVRIAGCDIRKNTVYERTQY